MDEKTKEHLFELLMIAVGLIGLLILFTVVFKGPRLIFNIILGYFNIAV